MDSNDKTIKNIKKQKILIGDKFIDWGIVLILLGPILGALSIFVFGLIVDSFISNIGGEALMIIGGVSIVGLGISLVIIGCTKNIIENLGKT